MTRLIVISSETDLDNETNLIRGLFDQGLDLFHLRKPNWTEKKQRNFLENLDLELIPHISIHQHCAHADEFGLSYLHCSEANRGIYTLFNSHENSNDAQGTRKTNSTSFHTYSKLEKHDGFFEYCFLSPVFNSISKKNYTQAIPENLVIDDHITTKVFALGGVSKSNIHKVFERKFYGAAVLGSIWNEPSKAIEEFKALNAQCRNLVHTY